MQKNHPISPAKKAIPALVAAMIMSIFIGVAILAFGLNALFNQNTSVAEAAAPTDTQASADLVSIQDLQAAVSQYQQREAQYQSELQQAAEKINQLSQQNQQYLQLTQALQSAGVIQITSDGQVYITRSAEPRSDFGDDDD
jgi:uncharacterized protein YlxW (UPF0749 family)